MLLTRAPKQGSAAQDSTATETRGATPPEVARTRLARASHERFHPSVAAFALLLLFAAAAEAQTPRPVLVSEPTSTRALALESVTDVREPFAPESAFAWGTDRRTRIRMFAMSLALRPGEDASAVSAFAEDGAGRRYTLRVEYVGAASGAAGVSELIVRLSDDLGEVGDVLVWISYAGVASNRVRVGIGHVGGGPPDDAGAAPTQPILLAGGVIQSGDVPGAVEVTLTGGTAPVTRNTAADGSYSFVVAPLNTYTLTPRTLLYDFEPASLTLDSIAISRGDLLFNARRKLHTISGRLRDEAGIELYNVTVRLTGPQGFAPRTLVTDDAGRFAFEGVTAGFDYTVTPLDNPVVTFSPAPTGQLVASVNLNLTGRRRTYAIRGRATDTDNSTPVAGATVTLVGVGSTTTDESGEYAFERVTAGPSYTVSMSEPNHVFQPPSGVVANLEQDRRLDFEAKPRIVFSGRVTDASGRGIFGVTVAIDGRQSGRSYTNADGNYSIIATARGDYTLTPSLVQNWYAYSPTGLSLAGVTSSRAGNDFTARFTPASSPSYVLEFDGTPKTVDYSYTFDDYTYFWPWDVDLGHFFWELWAMPAENAGGTYMISDGFGGGHAILFGVANFGTREPGRFQLLGNIWDGSNLTYFTSDEGPAPGEWGHYAAGWDGQYIVTYFNGVPVGRTRWRGPRRTPGPGGGGGRLFVGGSHHSNFAGRIAQIRGYEDIDPRESNASVYSTFRPETVFSTSEGSVMSHYFRPGTYMADLSRGYRNVPHTGVVRGWGSDPFPCFTCPLPQFVVDPTAPNFADPSHPGTPPAPVAPPASAPANALVFDSFARRNSTYALGGAGGIGSTEGGTAGALAWRTNVPADAPQPFGILNGRAVLLADTRALTWVDAGAGFDNFDARVARRPGPAESGMDTGLCFRVVDSENYFFAYTSEGADASVRLLTVGYYANGQRTTLASGVAVPAGWTTLRAVTNTAGLVEVYADGARLFAAQNSLMSTASGAGLYSNGPGLALANRWDNFTVFATPLH